MLVNDSGKKVFALRVARLFRLCLSPLILLLLDFETLQFPSDRSRKRLITNGQ